MDKTPLGDRMKAYENQETGRKLMPGLPVYARVDGRSFSNFTKKFKRPFDYDMSAMMVATTKYLVEETHAIVGYTQSDEISLAWLPSEDQNNMIFAGKIFKLVSNIASLATVKFNHLGVNSENKEILKATYSKLPTFDCRVCQIPDEDELLSMFIWRERDAMKNAVSMAASAYFSHKSLNGLTGSEKQERLFQEKGINFNDYPSFFKRGTYVRRVNVERHLTDYEMEDIPEQHRPTGPVIRSKIVSLDIPPVAKLDNAKTVLFGDLPSSCYK